MADAHTTITNLINSPPGQLAAGGVLFGIVWKFFERVESVASKDRRLRISIWLLDQEHTDKGLASKAHNWPSAFAALFDQMFGERHLTLRCFVRSCLVSLCGVLIMFGVWAFNYPPRVKEYFQCNPYPIIGYLPQFPFITALPDYLSLLKSRRLIKAMGHNDLKLVPFWIGLDIVLTVAISVTAYVGAVFIGYELGFISIDHLRRDLQLLWKAPTLNSDKGFAPLSALLYPSLFTTVWVTLYGSAGVLLRLARRLGPYFSWFNDFFDVEEKPLQSIGLVAGALVALAYWTAVIVSRIVS